MEFSYGQGNQAGLKVEEELLKSHMMGCQTCHPFVGP